MKRLLLILSFLLPSGCRKYLPVPYLGSLGTPAATAPGSGQAKIKVLLTGQSNMADFQNKPVFLDTIRRDLSDRVAEIEFVSCAHGGTSIAQWINSLAPACMADSQAQGASAILYYQGESDAMAGNSHWDQDFMTLVRMFRAKYPNIPIVYAQIGDMGTPPVNYPYWTDFQDLQLTIPMDAKMERITGKGLPLVPEGYVDLGPEAAEELAHRWAAALRRVL